MTNTPNAFLDDPAVAFRTAEVPGANWGTGGDWGGSNAHGLGIAIGGGDLSPAYGQPEGNGRWSVLDQFGNARAAQISQCIGGPGFVNRAVTPWPSSGGQEGTLPESVVRGATNAPNVGGEPDPVAVPTVVGGATLTDIVVGWTAVP